MKGKFFVFILIILVLAGIIYAGWSDIINLMLPSGSRPIAIKFATEGVSAEQYDVIAAKLKGDLGKDFPHIQRFKDSGIVAYEGPKTCLKCHKTIEINDLATKTKKKVDLMDNLTTSAHFRFYTKGHPNVWGFNGESADNFPMGKINRPCPKPGSFAMTAWASLVELKDGDTLSEGCGQCHIGGEAAPPLGQMMPGYKTTEDEKETIDCLICHSPAYDMKRKQVAVTDGGRKYWDQDRSLRAAMAVGRPTSQTCLRCHQHNLGGDIYVDAADSSYFQSMLNTGTNRPRVMHPGSKRGTPYSPSWDVHAAAGLDCIDCHLTEGHYIAKGTHTTTMMANDLPQVEVACENCHSGSPHQANPDLADYLNSHTEKIACVTCHIPSLNPDNATMRDFATTEYEEEPGIYVYTDIEKETEPGKGIKYVWWNGDATFLGNPIGDNPNGKNLYKFYKPSHVWPEFKDFDYDGWYEKVMRPIAQKGRPSKIYAMKLFNGRQHIDLQNMGPFGGMYLPYNLPTYYTTGNPDSAAKAEMDHPMMAMMYGTLFKYYMMDKFMSFMDVSGWNGGAYDDARNLHQVEARWIPQDAMLEISHAIRKNGALSCNSCHSSSGVIDFKDLGYDEEEAASLGEERGI
jgi:hypothetical protein